MLKGLFKDKMINNAGDAIGLKTMQVNNMDDKKHDESLLKNIVLLPDKDKQKAVGVRGALGDKKNTVFAIDVCSHGKFIPDKLQLKKEVPRSFDIYCDEHEDDLGVVVTAEECEMTPQRTETADEQFERIDPDAGIESFATSDNCESFAWKYDFKFDNLVCTTFSKLSGRCHPNAETEVTYDSDEDDTVLEEDW